LDAAEESTIRDRVEDFAPPEGFQRQIKVLKGAEIERLAEAYLSGKTVYELGREFGIHRATVSIILKRHGVPMRRQRLGEEHFAEVFQLHQEGMSYVRIGERFGVSETAVRNLLRKA